MSGPEGRKKTPAGKEASVRYGEAVSESMFLSEPHASPVTPREVARILGEAGIAYVLVGGHVVGSYSGKPRATLDVDVVASDPRGAADALQADYPGLEREENPARIRLHFQGREAVDVIRPESGKIFQEALDSRVEIELRGQKACIPDLETMMGLKFASLASPNRFREDRHQDAADFIRIYKAHPEADRPKLSRLGETVYAGGGKDLLDMLDRIDRDEPIRV